MKNKTIFFYLIQVAIIVFYCIYSVLFVHNTTFSKYEEKIAFFNDGWYIYNDDNNKETISIPGKIKADVGIKTRIYNIIPEEMSESYMLCFHSVHQSVDVYVDNEKIYSFGLKDSRMKSPGCNWNFIHLLGEYANKEICIEFNSNYSESAGRIPSFLIGSSDIVRQEIVFSKALDLFLSSLILLFGIASIIIFFVFNKKYMIRNNLLYLGMFATVVATWMVFDSNISTIFNNGQHMVSMIVFLLLLMFVYPLMEYARNTYKLTDIENKVIKSISISSGILATVLFILHMSGIAEFRETLLSVHIFMIMALGMLIYIVIKTMIKDIRSNKVNTIIHIAVFLTVMIPVLLDFYSYNFRYNDSLRIGNGSTSIGTKISVILFLLVLGYDSFKDAIKLMNNGKKFDRIKEIAYQDPLTKLRNRTAFDDVMKCVKKDEYIAKAILMVDLNNLKYFNDIFGHEMGDMYLKSASKIVAETFVLFGEFFRIGGDEFCMIVPHIDNEEYKMMIRIIEEKVDEMNCAVYEKKMGVSIGYAEFDPDKDTTLYNTMSRADRFMYEFKKVHKNNV